MNKIPVALFLLPLLLPLSRVAASTLLTNEQCISEVTHLSTDDDLVTIEVVTDYINVTFDASYASFSALPIRIQLTFLAYAGIDGVFGLMDEFQDEEGSSVVLLVLEEFCNDLVSLYGDVGLLSPSSSPTIFQPTSTSISQSPTTMHPIASPIIQSLAPTNTPTTMHPIASPIIQTLAPTNTPPTLHPIIDLIPTALPTITPTDDKTKVPTKFPTDFPTTKPSSKPPFSSFNPSASTNPSLTSTFSPINTLTPTPIAAEDCVDVEGWLDRYGGKS